MYKAWINNPLQIDGQDRSKTWGIRNARIIPDRQRVDLVGNNVKSIPRAELQVFFQDRLRVATS
jgi:hypothetical protein